ncbi:DUF317 domain-containing protein [Streptomyces sp. RY43-2]|uniref:DUF317 domain-containing protein n=1 Tax=Streptomyces macrolidinus TaxID=2952607 RepID=A0ABT0ZAA6_9ACTN|nr:DUF317 domain-containing protein [Streptomyces macrolidinus]MCN9240697.1 DUF317 domain-containing protein [Streptomyces macrolidinus]
MPPLDLGELTPTTEVLVAPVHLAGPGTREAVFSILDNAAGWSKAVAFGVDAYYASPCQRVRIANPVESQYGGWTITYAEDPLGVPDWITTFDRNTPQEIVAAFTETLVHSLPNHFRDYLSGGKHHTDLSPEGVLRRSNWQPAHGSRPHRIVSPDNRAVLRTRSGWLHEYTELLTPEKSMWRLSGGVDPVHVPSWRAFFSGSTPQHLRTAAAVALTSSDPVPRLVGDIPDRHRDLVHVRLAKPTDVVPRAQAALARRPRAAHVPVPRAEATTPPASLVTHGRSRRQR